MVRKFIQMTALLIVAMGLSALPCAYSADETQEKTQPAAETENSGVSADETDETKKDDGKYVVIQENFQNGLEQWSVGINDVAPDGIVLKQPNPHKHNSTHLVLIPPFQIPEDGELKLNVTITGFREEPGPGENVSASARMFIAPDPLPKWPEAYLLPTALTVWVNKNGDKDDAIISVYKKDNQEKGGCGDRLYAGSFATDSFPIRISLVLTKKTYRIRFDKPVDTSAGSRSGKLEMPDDFCGGALRFGMRLTSEADTAAAMTIGSIEIVTEKKNAAEGAGE